MGPDHLVSDYGFGEYSMDGYTVQGRASGFYDVTPVLGVQGDVLLTYDNIDNGSGDTERRAIDLALHGFYREADKFLVGTFVQLGRDGLYYNGNHLVDADRAYLGAEAQAYIDNLTLYVQGGLQQMSYDQSNAPSFDGWFGSVEARYFLTPDFRIDAHAGLSTLSDDNYGYEFKTSNIGFGAEYKFEDRPMSLFAKYDFINSKYDSPGRDGSLDQHRILVWRDLRHRGGHLVEPRPRRPGRSNPVESRAHECGFRTDLGLRPESRSFQSGRQSRDCRPDFSALSPARPRDAISATLFSPQFAVIRAPSGIRMTVTATCKAGSIGRSEG